MVIPPMRLTTTESSILDRQDNTDGTHFESLSTTHVILIIKLGSWKPCKRARGQSASEGRSRKSLHQLKNPIASPPHDAAAATRFERSVFTTSHAAASSNHTLPGFCCIGGKFERVLLKRRSFPARGSRPRRRRRRPFSRCLRHLINYGGIRRFI